MQMFVAPHCEGSFSPHIAPREPPIGFGVFERSRSINQAADNQGPEMIMSMDRKVTILLWTLGSAAALGLSTLSVLVAEDGRMSPWALVSFMWSVAMLAGLVHHLGGQDAMTRYRLRHKPLAGPREGAQLPS
jgi:hypothetical protein